LDKVAVMLSKMGSPGWGIIHVTVPFRRIININWDCEFSNMEKIENLIVNMQSKGPSVHNFINVDKHRWFSTDNFL